MTQYIKAPFNFVPLNEKVFFPEWADQVSNDIPFSDGESGEIELELEAMTPVFVRNGHTEADAKDKNDEYVSFSKDAYGNYFIPGTSIKGMIRNVLEILSFGKMDKISNDRYGFRDLQNNKDYMPLFQGGKVFCGYLRKINENEVEISDHGIPYRISHHEIDLKFSCGLSDFCSSKESLRSDNNRTAKKKYEIINQTNLEFSFRESSLLMKPKVDTRKFVEFADKGVIKGTLVVTGQPGVRQRIKKGYKEGWSGKYYEFVFPVISNKKETIPINHENDLRFKDFLFIHKDSSDWTNFRKRQLEDKQPIPVFFVRDNSGKILHFGMSYLYKIPYNKRVKDCLFNDHKKNSPDLSDLIFGNHQLGLKGRVQFSNAKLTAGVSGERVEPLMGSPKASYYPVYLQQNSHNGFLEEKFYQTYSSSNPILKGWKRYPTHDHEVRNFQVDEKQKKNISPFIPIKTGSKFSLKLRYHNLKPAELGALVLALNFKESGGFHSLGFAKSYGYGKIKLRMVACSVLNFERHYSEFKGTISSQIPGWDLSVQLKELQQMALSKGNDEILTYMTLSEFADAKSKKKSGNKLALPYFSEFSKINRKSGGSEKNIIPQLKKPFPGEKDQSKQKDFEQISQIQKPEIQADWKICVLYGEKIVKLEESDTEVFLVIPREKRNIELKVGDKVWVKIKQLKKDGSINQVEFMAKG